MIRALYAIVRPSGLRRIGAVVALMVVQSVIQTAAVFSLIPLLSAAADMVAFRASRIGGWFVDAVGGGSDQRVLVMAGSISLAVLVLGNLVTLAAEYHRARFAYGVAHNLRVAMLGALLDRRYEYFTRVNSSLLLKNLVDDTNIIAAQLVGPALDVIARGLLVVFLVAAVLAVEPLIVVGGAVVLTLYYVAVMRPVRVSAEAGSDALKEKGRQIYLEYLQVLNGIKPIIASARKAHFLTRTGKASREFAEEVPRIPMYSAIPRSGLEVLVFGGMIAWLLIALVGGSNLVVLMPKLGLVAVVAYRLMPSLQTLFAQVGAMSAARQALEEVTDVMDQQEAWTAVSADPDTSTEPLHWHREIRFENISFTYAGTDEAAIEGVSFVIPKGKRIAFVGPTGSGKSTLIDLLLGLLRPTAGRILIDGEPLSPDTMPGWRRAVGYVPQELFLLDGTIAENIAFGCDASAIDHDRVARVAELAQARRFIEDGRAGGFDARVGERGVKLSGGQRQRLALARALYSEPNVLVMDEATSALDTKTEQAVVAALAAGHEQLTIVTVTHRLRTVRDYDCIHYVEGGRIVASGDFATLSQHHAGFGELAH